MPLRHREALPQGVVLRRRLAGFVQQDQVHVSGVQLLQVLLEGIERDRGVGFARGRAAKAGGDLGSDEVIAALAAAGGEVGVEDAADHVLVAIIVGRVDPNPTAGEPGGQADAGLGAAAGPEVDDGHLDAGSDGLGHGFGGVQGRHEGGGEEEGAHRRP